MAPATDDTRYVLDTQFYIEILRGVSDGDATRQFLTARVETVDFHALVGAELLLGAADRPAAAGVRRWVIDRFKPARILALDANDLRAAGDALRVLRERHGDHPEHARRSFWNDVLIAVSCRRRGRVLVSRDGDHARIAAVVGHRVLTALPA